MRKWIQDQVEAIETFWVEVVSGDRKGKAAALTRFGLYLLSKVFEVLVQLRRFLYNVRILRDTTLGVQLIAVGNLTVLPIFLASQSQ